MEAAQQVLAPAADIARQQALANVEANIPDIATRIMDAGLKKAVQKAVEESLLIDHPECIYQKILVLGVLVFLACSMFGLGLLIEYRKKFRPADHSVARSLDLHILDCKLAALRARGQPSKDGIKDLEKGMVVEEEFEVQSSRFLVEWLQLQLFPRRSLNS
ncbi:hypothetical protein H2200_007690 [Cladophialophora chaetospira]|uniref:Uncharacterized protein n=1 Tax=Cladophialophora chaetospira TaxID=386627 RepID=A0AA38X686_9EURO|nr:hypothetical protein H2200_007690 [Cladophialophora chaetospira]